MNSLITKPNMELFCESCGVNLFEHGITEESTGGHAETEIVFNVVAGYNLATAQQTTIEDMDELTLTCNKCHQYPFKEDTKITADDVICYYEGSMSALDFLDSIA